MRVLLRSLRILGGILTLPALVLVAFSVLDHLDLLPADSPLYGIDFLPAAWLLLPLIPGVALMILGGWRKAGTMLALGLGAFLLAFGDVSLGPVLARPRAVATADTLRVAALNVRYYSFGVEPVAEALAQMHADIILLSENAFDSARQESAFVAAMTPMHYAAGHRNSEAILSRLPVLAVHEVALPSHEASLSGGNDLREQASHPHRSFLHAVVDDHGRQLHVIALRLIAGRPKDHTVRENLAWGRYLLETQMQEVACFERYVEHLQGPVIFGGDLNAPATSKVLRRLSRGARDAYLCDHFWGDLTFRTDLPTLRLDYLFGRNGIVPIRSCRPETVVSDHFAVWADFVRQEVND